MLYIENIVQTPNPQALKFVVNEILIIRETRNFNNKDEAEKDPLAKAVFEIEGVVSFFYMDKFITIEKEPDANWNDIQKLFINILRNFDKALIPAEEKIEPSVSNEDYQTFQKINNIIDERVRPALAGDGGGLDIIELKDNELKIRYMGACGSCPSSIHGTLGAIENLLRREINPSIKVISA